MSQTTKNGVLYGVFRDTCFAPDRHRAEDRMTFLIPGQGCVPWLKTQGEICDFCQLPAGTRFAVLGEGHEDHYESWSVSEADYHEMIDTGFEDSNGIDSVTVFNGGSFLTDREIPAATRQHLYRKFAAHPTAQNLMVESRPEFVTPEMIDEAQSLIGAKSMTVAIGLESVNDYVRNKVLHKFMGWKGFERALGLLQARGLRTFVYVFLGAPGLTDREAYEDAFASIKTLTDMGVDEINLSCAFIPPGGKLEKWHKEGTFRPPWLWTVAQLIDDACANGWPLSVGGFDDFPPPVAISHNCGVCDDAVLAAIEQHRVAATFDCDVTCDCKSEWSGLMSGQSAA